MGLKLKFVPLVRIGGGETERATNIIGHNKAKGFTTPVEMSLGEIEAYVIQV